MKPKSNHCAECEKRGELCPECAEKELDEGTPAGVIGEGDDAIPLVKFTVIGKKPKGDKIYEADDLDESNNKGIEDGMEHLKFLREQLAEAKSDELKTRLKEDISEWSALLLKRHKQHRPAPSDDENITDKKKTTSFLDSFNPSRPLGMR